MKHSNFLKVKVLDSVQPNEVLHVFQEDASVKPDSSPYGPIGRPRQKSNYELFNRNNFNIRYWSWNQTQLGPKYNINIQRYKQTGNTRFLNEFTI